MNKVLLSVALALGLCGSGCFSQSTDKNDIRFVDVDRILTQSKTARVRDSHIEAVNQSLKADLEKLMQAMARAPEAERRRVPVQKLKNPALTNTAEVGGHRVLLIHSHQFSYRKRDQQMIEFAKERGCDVVCYGHTHVADNRMKDGVLLLNPGSLRYSRDGRAPSYALLTLTPEQVVIEIDADDFSVAIGQQNIACRLYVPSNGKIFALGSYVLQCRIESN